MSEEDTDPASAHAGLFHTTPQPPGDDQKSAATDTTTLKLAADPATAGSSAPSDGDNAPLCEHDSATAAAAANTDAPTTEDAVAVDAEVCFNSFRKSCHTESDGWLRRHRTGRN